MIEARVLNQSGIAAFSAWLESRGDQAFLETLITSDEHSENFNGVEIDPTAEFKTRYDLGVHLATQLAGQDFRALMSPKLDGMWAWLAAVYFAQLTAKGVRRGEHYLVTRKGAIGSLAYRHAIRTPYELVKIHGECARICLSVPINTMGEIAEEFASRQTIARNKGFFKTAYSLYFDGGSEKLRRGAAAKPKKPKDRIRGDKTGLGGARRLALALQRLDLTYDTEAMEPQQVRSVLPKEFAKWG